MNLECNKHGISPHMINEDGRTYCIYCDVEIKSGLEISYGYSITCKNCKKGRGF